VEQSRPNSLLSLLKLFLALDRDDCPSYLYLYLRTFSLLISFGIDNHWPVEEQECSKLGVIVSNEEMIVLKNDIGVVPRDADVWHSHACIKGSTNSCISLFLVCHHMYCLHLFLSVDCLEYHEAGIGSLLRNFILVELECSAIRHDEIHRIRNMAQFAADYSPLVRMGRVRSPRFSL
jgi:hypothetical protein